MSAPRRLYAMAEFNRATSRDTTVPERYTKNCCSFAGIYMLQQLTDHANGHKHGTALAHAIRMLAPLGHLNMVRHHTTSDGAANPKPHYGRSCKSTYSGLTRGASEWGW